MNPVILYSVVTLGAISAGAAMILFFVAKKFKVEEDPRIDDVTELLPGANCGGCGFPGCRGFGEALVKAADDGDISALSCPPGGNDTMAAVGKYLGMEVSDALPLVAVLRCGGTHAKAPSKLTYDGPSKCTIAHNLFSGENGCPHGCLGLADCVVSCEFDAMYMDPETGLPVIIEENCVACGACVKACPRLLIEMRLKGRRNRRVWVNCINEEKGGVAMKNCKAACIGCSKCVKECPEKVQAFVFQNNLAYIDMDKCIACGLCVHVCPTNAILATFEPVKPKPKRLEAKKAAEAEAKAAAKEKIPAEAKKEVKE